MNPFTVFAFTLSGAFADADRLLATPGLVSTQQQIQHKGF